MDVFFTNILMIVHNSSLCNFVLQELVIAASYHGNSLQAYRLIDGALTATVSIPEPTYLTTDNDSSTIYCSSFAAGQGRVLAFQWRMGSFVSTGVVAAAGATDSRRPIAYIPPAFGKSQSYLVVGSQRSPTLLVLAIPSMKLVHTYKLEGVSITGLGCDAAPPDLAFKLDGNGARPTDAMLEQKLVVLDHTTNVVLLVRWPLPGMPVID